MDSMMKASPKFETCLFGPSAKPIPIIPYQQFLSNNSTNNSNSNSNNNNNNNNNTSNSASESKAETKSEEDVEQLSGQVSSTVLEDGKEIIPNDATTSTDTDNATSTDTPTTNTDTDTDTDTDTNNDAITDNLKQQNEIDSNRVVVSSPSSNGIGTSTHDGNDHDADTSTTTNTTTNTSTTPPQTPVRATPPPRPAKVITKSHKKTSSSSASVSSSSTTTNTTNTQKQKPTNNTNNNNNNNTNNHTINLQELRRLSSQGVPDECTHRPLAWRVLLGYLPLDTTKWQSALNRDRTLYHNLVNELFVYSPDHDYPFELEGGKLIGRGLNYDGRKGFASQKDADKMNNWGVNKNHGGSGSGSDDSGDSNDNTHGEGVEVSTNDVDSLRSNDQEASTTTTSDKKDNNNDTDADTDTDTNNDTSTQINKDATSTDNNSQSNDDGDGDGDADDTTQFSEKDTIIPQNVREQWRKSGRDPDCLMAGMGKTISGRFVNALLVTNNETASTKTNDKGKKKKYGNNNNNNNNYDDEDYDDDYENYQDKLNIKISKSLEGEYDPKWRHFLENASLLDEIRKDVVRTHPDLKFFLEPRDNIGPRRYAAIERILFVWAKLNKGVRYVQGMNEIVGTLYFVLANDENEEWACEAEADTYFLFNTLMVEMRDIFVPDLDEADTGIQGRMANMIALLSLHDPEVRCHLDDCGIDPGFYSIRWLTTLLSREFLLPDTIRLWDSMFASTHKDNFMRYVCVCMVMVIREDLLKGDFGTCLRLLQAYPPTNVDQLLESSRALWIYESQVTLACHKGGISLSQALSTIAPPPAVIMAYGLHGGLAVDQVGRARQDMQNFGERKQPRNNMNMRFRKNKNSSGANNNNTTATATSTAAKSLFGFLGLSSGN